MSDQKKTSKRLGGSPSQKGQALRSAKNKRLAIERDAGNKLVSAFKWDKRRDNHPTHGSARALRRSNGQVATDEQRIKNIKRAELEHKMIQPIHWIGSISSGHYVFGKQEKDTRAKRGVEK